MTTTPTDKQQGLGLAPAMTVAALLGVGVVAVAVAYYPRLDDDSVFAEPSVEYGRLLVRETAAYMGPGHDDPAMRFSGSGMDCASCHIDTGTEPGTLSLLLTDLAYPRFSGRDG
ncbi:MAG: hypothetical protein RL120_10695, partial [Gammaproteobacteria bacterium]